MKRQWRKIWLLCLPAALWGLAACSDPVATVDDEGTRYEGDECNDTYSCVTGLTCYGGLCRKVCQSDKECKSGQECTNNICVTSSKSDIVDDLEIGETCNDSNRLCKTGLTCVNNICKKTCKDHGDCDTSEYCNKNECVARPDPSKLGEACDDEITVCATGLECLENKCAQPCTTADDCPTDSIYSCDKNYCVKNENQDQPSTRAAVAVPTGANLSPVSGVVRSTSADKKITVRVVGGSIQSQASSTTNTIQVHDGSWKTSSPTNTSKE